MIKKILLILISGFVLLGVLSLIFKPQLESLLNKKSNNSGSGGVWSGLAVKLSYTDLSTNEIKEGRIEEGPIGFEAPFDMRATLLSSDYSSEAKIKLEKGDQSQVFTLKKGESAEFLNIKIEVLDFINSPCPAGAVC